MTVLGRHVETQRSQGQEQKFLVRAALSLICYDTLESLLPSRKRSSLAESTGFFSQVPPDSPDFVDLRASSPCDFGLARY